MIFRCKIWSRDA